jgi:hypothetical protein
LPVGNSDKGVGLWAGQIMVGLDNNYQYIDWGHPQIGSEDAIFAENDGDHLGTLSAKIVSPSITIGLSNYWNMTYSQVFGIRSMTWGKDWDSVHHRNEDSNSDFDNAIGGLLGDSRVMFRYLFLNDGAGPGHRLFFGGGLVIPSKNTLKSSPFFPSPEETEPHRYFSMSEGVYKAVFETQYFVKRKLNPIFIGGTFSIEQPLGESEYGFKASRLTDLSFTAFSKKVNLIKASVGASFMVRHTTMGYWNDKPAPNSESLLIVPGVGFLWNLGFGTMAVNLQKPYFLDGSLTGTEGTSTEKTDVYQFSVSMRKTLDYSIPFLEL